MSFSSPQPQPQQVSNTTIQKAEIPAELKRYVVGGGDIPASEALLPRALQLSTTPLAPLPGAESRLAGFTPGQQAALTAIQQRGLAGTPGYNEAGNYITNLLTTNPYNDPGFIQQLKQGQQDIVGAFNTSVAPRLSALSRASGSFGNSGVGEVANQAVYGPGGLGRNLADFESSLLQNRQQQALQGAGLIPTLQQVGYTDLSQALTAGSAEQSQQQQALDIAFQNLLEQRQQPFSLLDVLGSALGTAGGTALNRTASTTGTQYIPAGPNPFLSAIGAGGSFLGGLGLLAGAL